MKGTAKLWGRDAYIGEIWHESGPGGIEYYVQHPNEIIKYYSQSNAYNASIECIKKHRPEDLKCLYPEEYKRLNKNKGEKNVNNSKEA